MAKQPPKHTVIVDADLHIQDPHDIILSYFNTGNDNQFVHGEKASFRNRLVFVFLALVMLKFFFEEKFSNAGFFAISLVLFAILGVIFSYGIYYLVCILNRAVKKDSVRGLSYQLVFITIIVLLICLLA